ncbi:Fructose-1,6-bisphosphate aldolase [Spironucleus salmonicida]|uniref:fructose-bisphosphate aldolase n=1 Tax=Spironucleus salmonicida TaxID=348837 RepID=V6M755_9EUKA|nr:Fructose-1,6-bisphosphate aldolase [Spironucleus salmonicida]|eukprot:EST49254.1 Fructose-1,6-bisphosphate aldolase [Spironucleus salmonicida]
MPLCTLKQILAEAKKGKYGVGAYNVNNMEQIQAIMLAAQQTKSPVIIQCSRGALKYADMIYLKKLMEAAVELNKDIPVCIHLDHGDTFESCKNAISLGFTSVMIDASHHSFEENVKITKQVVDYAHAHGVSVEAELGQLGGMEEDITGSVCLTNPEEAKKFVQLTGVDALAVAIGTSHGAYKFPIGSDIRLAIDLVGEIESKTSGIPLVMHGSSSIPTELREKVNKYGGKMPDAIGVPIESIQAAIKLGICKINVDSDSRMAMTAAVRQVFVDQPDKFDPRDYLGPARIAITECIVEKMNKFGTAGHAGDYTPYSLEDAKAMYAKK